MPGLAGIIQKEIETGGPITFARFMEQALYHPELGYYTSPGNKIGRAGDFYTAPVINPLFGAMLARRIEQLWRDSGRPKRWVVVEYGPGTGVLARDIMVAVHRDYPDLYTALEYYLIDVSTKLIEIQQRTIGYKKTTTGNFNATTCQPAENNGYQTANHNHNNDPLPGTADASKIIPNKKFHWVGSLAEIEPGYINNGCILANEFVDAFPVHLVIQNNTGLQELYVGLKNNNNCNDSESDGCNNGLANAPAGINNHGQNTFTLIPGPLSTTELASYFSMQGIQLENGQRAEVNLQARRWLAEIAPYIKKGYVIIIDYGATSRELYTPHRFSGTLRCFYKHRLVDNPLINVGDQDITAHINFSSLIIWGGQLGLHNIEFTTQPQFLLNMGILDLLQKQPDYTQSLELKKITSAIKQLVLPGGMGNIFKVLIQGKGVRD